MEGSFGGAIGTVTGVDIVESFVVLLNECGCRFRKGRPTSKGAVTVK